MSTVLSIKELEKETKKFDKLNSVSNIVKNLRRSEIPEEVLLYLLEVKDNRHKVKSIEKFENVNENKAITKTELRVYDIQDCDSRRAICKLFGVKFEYEISKNSFKNTKGILNGYINNKIDPVKVVRDIRES